MSAIRRIARKMGFLHASEVEGLVQGMLQRAIASTPHKIRGYVAAKQGMLTADWIVSPLKADADIRAGMVPVRARARDLEQNNDYVKAYLRASRRNIVGHAGFILQVKAKNSNGELDSTANAYIEQRFAEWARPGMCEVTGRFSFRKVQSLMVNAVKRDGEVFVRKVRGANVNKFGLSLQLVDADMVDEQLNAILPNGNVLRMGIETTPFGKPVAYHFKVRRADTELYGPLPGGPYERVPAEDVYHLFDPERIDQTRAVSQIAQSMTRLRHLNGYEEAALVNARASACKMGFFCDPDNETLPPYPGDGVANPSSAGSEELVSETTPGTLEDIGKKKFIPYDPKYPDSQHDPFVKSHLRGVSAGLGLSYSTLSQDLSDVNYSSIRAGLVEEREEWKEQQEWFKESFLVPLYQDWLDMALLMGALGGLPAEKFWKFVAHEWIGRRWAWVDPEKDINSAIMAVESGFRTRTSVIAESGRDIEDVYQELAEEKKIAKKYGLDFESKPEGGKGNGKPGSAVEDDEEGNSASNGSNGKGNGRHRGSNGRDFVLV